MRDLQHSSALCCVESKACENIDTILYCHNSFSAPCARMCSHYFAIDDSAAAPLQHAERMTSEESSTATIVPCHYADKLEERGGILAGTEPIERNHSLVGRTLTILR